jgi:hypothetical protein
MLRSVLHAAVAVFLMFPGVSLPHGLLLDAESDGTTITGVVYYTNGDLAVQESVELLDLTTPNASPSSSKTDGDGRFRFPAEASHRYRVSAYGEEGHSVDVELEATMDARPKLVEPTQAAEADSWTPPAWAVIGGLLILSLVPAVFRSSRKPASAPLAK